MKFKKLFLTFWALAFFFFAGFASDANAAVPTGGLWGQYSERITSWYYSFEEVSVENLNFDNFDGVLQSHLGQHNDAQVIWRGAIYAENAGNYNFRFDLMNLYHSRVRMAIDGSTIINRRGNQNPNSTQYLSKGWHGVVISNVVSSSVSDSKMKFYWTQPGQKEQIVPADKLSYNFWSNTVVTVPKDGKEKMDYVAAGVGARDESNPKIEIQMPSDVNDSDLLKEDVLIVWYKKKDESKGIKIKNEHTGTEISVTGTALTTDAGDILYYDELYAYLPSGVVGLDGSGELKLSFKKTDGTDFYDGIGIVVSYKDDTKPEGKLSLRMVGGTGYHGAAPTMVFPVKKDVNDEIKPVFFLSNGETKTEAPTKYRPNYMVMLSGKGSEPGVDATLKNMPGAKMFVPEVSKNFSLSNSDTWYPCYGREGTQFDVLSSNYVPNKWGKTSGQYKNSSEGEVDTFSIPDDHTWVAFQYYGSNYSSDGVTGSGESGSISGGGLFSSVDLDGPDEFDLNVISSGNGKVTGNSVKKPVIGINCPNDCYEKYEEGDKVTLTATPNGTSSFIGWTDDCVGFSSSSVCILDMNSEKTASAQFTMPGVCGGGVGQNFCSEPRNKCLVGSSTLESYDSATKTWSWRCSNSGDLSATCSATKNCGINERTP
ncbi:MAG: hypothetical protein U9O20_02605 [Patescibacteria group bacterium]|nr:hypothetical protein [Patescibacteria group bacterium]